MSNQWFLHPKGTESSIDYILNQLDDPITLEQIHSLQQQHPNAVDLAQQPRRERAMTAKNNKAPFAEVSN
jgi:hypothetical protein